MIEGIEEFAPRRVSREWLSAAKLPAVFLPDEKAAERFFGFFTANIRNKNTRRAYYKATCRFSDWCEGRGLLDLVHVKPSHVSTRPMRSAIRSWITPLYGRNLR